MKKEEWKFLELYKKQCTNGQASVAAAYAVGQGTPPPAKQEDKKGDKYVGYLEFEAAKTIGDITGGKPLTAKK
jgi:hypothetical protein